MKLRILGAALAFVILLSGTGAAAQTGAHAQSGRATVSGYITDAKTGETLISAGVVAREPAKGAGQASEGIASASQAGEGKASEGKASAGLAGTESGITGAVTNPYGFYTLTLGKGRHELTFSYMGYSDQSIEVNLQRDTTINITLNPDLQLSSATVVATKDAGILSTKMSAIEVPVTVIQQTPTLFGEADVLKTIQLMPGVQAGMEGFSGIYVRGGGPEENLLLLDGISLYNAEHLLGIFSIFQPEAVKKVTLYKGSFPAR